MIEHPRNFLKTLFQEAVRVADPELIVKPFVPDPPKGRTVVIGVGKAVAKLALALEQSFKGPLSGTVVTPYGHKVECNNIEVIEAAHPIPDENGLFASKKIFEAVKGLTEDDLVIALVCGGGSALLPAPPKLLSLHDEIALNEVLLSSGLPISKMNLIRKHVSEAKGGKLGLACYPARLLTLVLSDVPGDELHQVASGPTIADSLNRKDALNEISLRNLKLPKKIMKHLNSSKADCPTLDMFTKLDHEIHMIGSAHNSLLAAKRKVEEFGLTAVVLSDSIEGEAAEIGKMHGAIVNQINSYDQPFCKPVVLLSGGETTVKLNHFSGRGGRNTEFLLSFLLSLQGDHNTYALAADTDGIDGSESNAGAFGDAETLNAIRVLGINPEDLLLSHNAYLAFEAAESLFFSGPTGTNVNDFRAIFIST